MGNCTMLPEVAAPCHGLLSSDRTHGMRSDARRIVGSFRGWKPSRCCDLPLLAITAMRCSPIPNPEILRPHPVTGPPHCCPVQIGQYTYHARRSKNHSRPTYQDPVPHHIVSSYAFLSCAFARLSISSEDPRPVRLLSRYSPARSLERQVFQRRSHLGGFSRLCLNRWRTNPVTSFTLLGKANSGQEGMGSFKPRCLFTLFDQSFNFSYQDRYIGIGILYEWCRDTVVLDIWWYVFMVWIGRG